MSIFQSTRKMTAKEQMIFDLGYGKAIAKVVDLCKELRIGNIGRPPYTSVDREYLQYNQALSDLLAKLETK